VRVVQLGRNAGFAGAANAGAEAARAELVVFLNNDAEVEDGWATELVAAFEDTAVVMAGGLTVFADRPDVVNTAGIRLLPTGGGTDDGLGRTVGEVSLEPRDVPGVSGVSMAVRRDWFVGSGGFDAGFFMYFEDVDLCLRALLEGHRIRFVPTSVVRHRFGASAGVLYSPLRSYYASRNRLLVIVRNFDGPAALGAAALSVVQDAGIVAMMLARGELALARASAWHKLRGTAAGLALAAGPYRATRRELAARRTRTVADLRRAGLLESVAGTVRELVRVAGAMRT
jgi:GT2 family glycosyltransferase